MARDHREKAEVLAKAIHAAILTYNRAHPVNPYAIDDRTSRILENDRDYHPPRKRTRRKDREPTLNPGIFTVQAIADALETTIGELLGEPGYELTKSDLRSFRWMADFLRMRFPLEEVDALPDTGSFIQKDFSFPRPLSTTRLANTGELAAGPVPVESEFEVVDATVIGDLKSPSLVAATVTGRSMSVRRVLPRQTQLRPPIVQARPLRGMARPRRDHTHPVAREQAGSPHSTVVTTTRRRGLGNVVVSAPRAPRRGAGSASSPADTTCARRGRGTRRGTSSRWR